MKSIRLGIVGLGGMGSYYANNILLAGKIPALTLSAVCDSHQDLSGRFPGQKCFQNAEEMFASGTIDAVLIATPHYSHTPLGIAAFKAGLHVMMEKPISVHKADCERLIAARRNECQVFGAMFVMRTYPMFREIKRLIDNGELGEIRRINWVITDWYRTQAYYDSGSWRGTWEGEGGGVLLNQCPHQLDLWQWLFGIPSRVHAICRIGRYHDIEVEDDVTATFEYANGTTGVFVTSTGEFPGTNRLEITGERGRLVAEDGVIKFAQNEVPMTEHSRSTTERSVGPAMRIVDVPIGKSEIAPAEEILGNFAAAILKGETLIAPAVEGIHSVEMGNAMMLSSLQDKTIDLPMDSAIFERELNRLIVESRERKNSNAG